ncbi:Bifunctional inhibitor/lipid-transfer protein/seed storage 2S albumin superfamily protein [Rhynchospora pubera]|uniref:Bifunctional inhibitor/lipid-transfer protein/seed storage 2S albumin superfamily protein n=1 Tax=Rhynchospora pubera TaxID=906938 RepID=A0AAV8D1Y4_9POAL|nr:Bifunctional inhibitor/lipid-transfer protein/seed storage 2S albumin superfamily protein [Rhynchospora pubera]
MEQQNFKHFRFTIFLLGIMLTLSIRPINGQVSQSCTASLISSFTPCFNFITGSTNGGGSPTAGCCQALSALISTSTDCACLILTGNVPLGSSLPINRTLAISLPKACKKTNSSSVPLKCRDTSTPLPGPGPVAYAPGLPPLSPSPPESSDTPLAMTPSFTPGPKSEPTSPPPSDDNSADQGFGQGAKPLIFPSSVVRSSQIYLISAYVLILFVSVFAF